MSNALERKEEREQELVLLKERASDGIIEACDERLLDSVDSLLYFL